MRSRYRELGLKLTSLVKTSLTDPSNLPWKMKKKDDGVGDPIKMLLEESLT
jgi:hypothetical protein